MSKASDEISTRQFMSPAIVLAKSVDRIIEDLQLAPDQVEKILGCGFAELLTLVNDKEYSFTNPTMRRSVYLTNIYIMLAKLMENDIVAMRLWLSRPHKKLGIPPIAYLNGEKTLLEVLDLLRFSLSK